MSRPGFKIDTIRLQQSHRVPRLKKVIKTKTEDPKTRPSDFFEVPLKARSIASIQDLEEAEKRRLGAKVTLSDETLDKILGIKIQDPSDPGRTIIKRVSVGKLMETLDGSLAGIENLMRNIGTASQGDLNTLILLSQNIINELGMAGMTSEISESVSEALSKAGSSDAFRPGDEIAADLAAMSIGNLLREQSTVVPMLLSNIPDSLSPSQPIFGVDGEPVSFQGAISQMQQSPQRVLDVGQRRIFGSSEEALLSRIFTESPSVSVDVPTLDPTEASSSSFRSQDDSVLGVRADVEEPFGSHARRELSRQSSVRGRFGETESPFDSQGLHGSTLSATESDSFSRTGEENINLGRFRSIRGDVARPPFTDVTSEFKSSANIPSPQPSLFDRDL